MPRIYIAGPMTGRPNSNYPAFNAAAEAWREAGWEVENPAEHFGGDTTRRYVDYVEVDIVDLQQCDAIAMLPGWDGPNARGSVWERAIAVHLLHIPVYDADKVVTRQDYCDSLRDPLPPNVVAFIDEVLRG